MSKHRGRKGHSSGRGPPRPGRRGDRRSCAYCGAPAAAVDHVPPRAVYGKPLPAVGPITVPVCPGCHRDTAKDDEAFRDALVVITRSRGGVVPERVRRAIDASLEKSDKKYRPPIRDMLGRSKQALLQAESGEVEPAVLIPISPLRLLRVADRIVRGLYWHERGHPVPPSLEAAARFDFLLEQLDEPHRTQIQEIVLAAVREPPVIVVDGVFRCFRVLAADDNRHGAWVLEFYGCVRVLAVVSEVGDASPNVSPQK